MARLELTTKMSSISTSSKARGGGMGASASVSKAMANLRYITRESSAPVVASAGPGIDANNTPGDDRKAVQAALEARAKTGGEAGRNVAQRITVSLPNEWPDDAKAEALTRLVQHFAPRGSEALAVGALHRNKPGNSHLHLLVVDGRESEHEALMRNARAGKVPKRVRRRDVHRFNADLGRPKQIREAIAGVLNLVAERRGLEGVEHRSFKARGIERAPGTHRGPAADAKDRKAAQSLEAGRRWDGGGGCISIDPRPPQQRPQEPQEGVREAVKPKPVPQPPTPPQPKQKKVFRWGRWMTVEMDEEGTPRKPKPQRGRERER